MAVDALARARVDDVLALGLERGAEQALALLPRGVRVRHGVAPRHALHGHGAARLGAALLEAPRRRRLVRRPVAPVHLVVGQLDHHLHVRVGRAAEALDQALAVALVGLHRQLVLADDRLEVRHGAGYVLLHLLVDAERDGLGVRQGGAHARVREVQLVVEDEHVDVVVEPVRRRAVHHRVLADEARRAVVVDDELQRLVEPAVAPVAVPVLVRPLR